MAARLQIEVGDVLRVTSWRPGRAAWFVVLNRDTEINKPILLALAWTALTPPPSFDDVPYLSAVDLSAFDGPELPTYMLNGLRPLSITVTGRDAWRPTSPYIRRWATGVHRPLEAEPVGDLPYFYGRWDSVKAVANGPELEYGPQATEGRLQRHGSDVSTYVAAAEDLDEDRATRFDAAPKAAGLEILPATYD